MMVSSMTVIDRLLRFAPPCALARQEQVLGQLLADGGAAGNDLAFLQVLFVGLLDRLPVETLVIEKFGVFGSNDGPLELVRDARDTAPTGA